MANFETEHKAAPSPLENGDAASSSIAICEDNLAALLRVMNGSAESAPAASQPAASEPVVPAQAPVAPVEGSVPSPAESLVVAEPFPYTSPELERPLEPEPAPAVVSENDPASAAEARAVQDTALEKDPVAGKELRVNEVVIVEDAVADRNPVVETFVFVEAAIIDDATVTEKDPVAQIDAIAVRSAGTVSAAEAETPPTPEAPVQPHANLSKIPEPFPETVPAVPGVEVAPSTAGALPKVASQLALLSSIKQRRTMTGRSEPANLPVPETNVPTPVAPLVEAAPPPKAALPGKKKKPERAEVSILLPIPDPETQMPEPPRGNTYLDRMEELAKAPAPWTPPSHAGPAQGTVVTSMYTRTYQDTAKPKSFAKSGTGLTLIAGTILALGVTGYFLLGFDFKPVAIAPPAQPVVEESVPAKKTVSKRPSGERSPAEKSSAPAVPVIPGAVDRKVEEKSAPSPVAAPLVRTDVVPKDIVQKDSAQKADTGQAVVVGNSVSVVARTFAPPTSGPRPAQSPVLETPPAIATPSSVPATLPAGIAPLPPPAAPPSTASATGPRQINVTGKAQAAKLVRQVKPAYPALARATRLQGTVRFRAIIAADGQIKNLTSLSGPSPLVQAATDAVRQWRYQPTLVNGEAVEVVTEIDVAFTL